MMQDKFAGIVRLVGHKHFLRLSLNADAIRALPVRENAGGDVFVDLEISTEQILDVLEQGIPMASLVHHFPIPSEGRCDVCNHPRAFTTFEGRKLCLRHYLEAYPVEDETDAIHEVAIPPAVVV